MIVHKVLNAACKAGEHKQCPVKSVGSKSDPHTYICICECHK